ncbi:terminase small subunit [Rhizobium phage RHEph08]|uniref:Putative terminase protein small subunit n=2 Tax=Cuernavacavirus TaxID=2731935 RepID=L7TKC7_9CAUD|nr:terminase small subunit [Rhizobium phage RHEph08]YP_009793291.1 terminase small subunit [Rhizobium phage RHEph09]AGC35978.1 putative terminase protein small subunit [Rhizobium phage RHEph08]AGC36032.1 putative terminase protein small subunit [Rhizobium phage RHEph09]
MSTNAANEATLGTLHTKVANVMIGILDTTEKAIAAYEEVAETADAEQLATMVKPELSPAMLSAMTKFLSDNKITCNAEEGSKTSALEQRLASKKRRVGNVVPFPNED